MKTAIPFALTVLAGCGGFGRVNQGQVVEYRHGGGLITLVSDSNYRDPEHPRFDILPAVTIRTPEDPREMGPAPLAGRLLALDCAGGGAVFFDANSGTPKTVPCTLVSERAGVPPGDARVANVRFPVIDRTRGAITIYVARERRLVEFSVPAEFRDLPDETWRIGDMIRYYYRDPGRALRLMNVSRTDLNKAGK